MRETRVRALGWEDPLEKEMAIHSSTVAWKIPWTEEPGRLQSMGSQRVGHDWATSLSLSSNMISYLGISSPVLCKFESEVGGTAQLHLTASETQMQMNTFRDWWESHFSSHRAKPNKDCHWHTHRQSYVCAVTVRENKINHFHKLLVKKFHFVNIWNVQIKHKRTHHSNLSKMSTFYCLAWDLLCF